MLLRLPGVCRPVVIFAARQITLDFADVGLAHQVQLVHFDDPNSLKQLRRVLSLERAQAVREPLPPHQPQQRRFSDSLRTSDHGHGIEFHARFLRPGDGSRERFPRDLPRICAVFSSEVINKESIEPGLPVPLEAVEIVRHRVVAVLSRREDQPVVDDIAPAEFQDPFEVVPDARVVLFLPSERAFLVHASAPRQRRYAEDIFGEVVEAYPPFERRIVHDHGLHVLDRLLRFPCVRRQFQELRPFDVALRMDTLEGFLYFVVPLPVQRRRDRRIRHGEPAGRRIARQFIDRRFRFRFLVEAAELVQPEEVESVHEFPAAWIRRVMREKELPVLVHDGAARRRPARIGEAVLHSVHGGIDAGDEFIHDVINGIRPAECADHAFLLRRILLLRCVCPLPVLVPWNLRPQAPVVPVLV